jgi:hypothetical protein
MIKRPPGPDRLAGKSGLAARTDVAAGIRSRRTQAEASRDAMSRSGRTNLSQGLRSEGRERRGYWFQCCAPRVGEIVLKAHVPEPRTTRWMGWSVRGSGRSLLERCQGRAGSGRALRERESSLRMLARSAPGHRRRWSSGAIRCGGSRSADARRRLRPAWPQVAPTRRTVRGGWRGRVASHKHATRGAQGGYL